MHGKNRICTLVDRERGQRQCHFQNRSQHLMRCRIAWHR